MFRWASAHRHLSRNRFRSRQRRHAADGRCAGWKRRRRWYQKVVTLPRRRTIRIREGIACHANAGKGVDVGVRSREAVGERLEERNDLVLLRIAQAQLTNRHVKVVGNLGHRPAVYFFGFSCRAVPRSYREGVYVARIIEVHELLQALDVAVVEELLLEVRSWSLRGRTLWWYQGDVACRRRLHLAIRSWRKLCPCIIRACPRAGTASQESSQSQISEAEAKWIRGKAEEIWLVLIIDGIPGIQRQAEISRAEAGEYRSCVCCRACVFTVRRRACGRRRRWRSGPAIQM